MKKRKQISVESFNHFHYHIDIYLWDQIPRCIGGWLWNYLSRCLNVEINQDSLIEHLQDQLKKQTIKDLK